MGEWCIVLLRISWFMVVFLGEMYGFKICKILDMVLKIGVLVIGMNDSGGVRI